MLAELFKSVHQTAGPERAAICAYDCMRTWDEWGEHRLKDTIEAWNRYLREIKNKEPHTDCNRYGIWAPAIPL